MLQLQFQARIRVKMMCESKTQKYNTVLINKICIVIMLEIIVGIVMYYGSFPILSQPIHLFLATILFGYQFYWFLHFTKIKQ